MDAFLDFVFGTLEKFFSFVIGSLFWIGNQLIEMFFAGELLEFILRIIFIPIIVFVLYLIAEGLKLNRLYYFLREGSNSSTGISPNIVRGLISTILAVWAIYCVQSRDIQLSDFLKNLIPMGDYLRIDQMFNDSTAKTLVIQIGDIVMQESLMTALNILPVVLVDVIDACIKTACRSERYANRIVAAFFKFVYCISILVLEYCYDNPNLEFHRNVYMTALRGGVIGIVIYAVIAYILLSFASLNIMNNDALIAVFSFNISIRILEVPLLAWQQIVYMVLCFLCGAVSSLIRERVYEETLVDDNIFGLSLIYALISMAVCTGVALLLLWGAKALLG